MAVNCYLNDKIDHGQRSTYTKNGNCASVSSRLSETPAIKVVKPQWRPLGSLKFHLKSLPLFTLSNYIYTIAN